MKKLLQSVCILHTPIVQTYFEVQEIVDYEFCVVKPPKNMLSNVFMARKVCLFILLIKFSADMLPITATKLYQFEFYQFELL